MLERALELTAEYARTREQFDRPIGSFQAVSQRLADDYIDIKGLRLTLQQASWRLSEDLPADAEVATAAFWAAEAGHRVAHTTVHVHGGVGIDMDHPVHRYFITAKQTEFALGGATAALRDHRPRSGRHPCLVGRQHPPSPGCWSRWPRSTTAACTPMTARTRPGASTLQTAADLAAAAASRGWTRTSPRMSESCWATPRCSRRCWWPPG